MIDILLHDFYAYIFVFVRMAAMILFNPLFARRNLPNQVRIALILALTIILAPTVDTSAVVGLPDISTIVLLFWELLVGFTLGFIYQTFYYLLFFVGDVMDMQFGMSMAKVFDPSSNLQMSISGNFLNLMFVLYIFATDSHLVLIHIFSQSFNIVPLGTITLPQNLAGFVVNMFSAVFMLSIRLILPFLVAEFTLEICMGILMKVIPQIHVFVINIQAKMLIGITLLFLFAGPVSGFMDNYVRIMLENIQNALTVLV